MSWSTYAKSALALSLLFLSVQSANGDIPKECYDLYVETGARPLGPNAPYIDILTTCVARAVTAPTDLSTYYCTASSGSSYIDEYCGTGCPEDMPVDECFCFTGQEPNQFAHPGDMPPCTFPPDEEPGDEPQEEKEKGESCDGEGNPCSPASGNKYQSEVDYSSHNGRLEVVRHYNSLSPHNGAFGFGWTSAITRKLIFEDEAQDRVTIEQADGRRENWINRGGSWSGDPDTQLKLEADATGYKVSDRDGRVESYDPSGKLISDTNPQGHSTNYTYDSEERLVGARGPFGRELSIVYNTNNQIASITTPDGELQYDYDTAGNLVSVTYPDRSIKTYHYEDTDYPHNLTGITDESNTRYATWTYDDNGRVATSEHAGETDKVAFSYNSDNSTTVSDALGAERTYQFITLHGVRKVQSIQGDRCTSCTSGDMRERTYDDDGNLTGYTDWSGNQTTLSYNDRGLVETRTEAVGEQEELTTTFEWHSDFDRPVRINQSESLRSFTYNSTGQILTTTETDNITNSSRTYTYSYVTDGNNGAGLLAAIDGPLPGERDITRFEYDVAGNLTSLTNALGHTTRISQHDSSGRPLVIVDPNGLTTTLSYDPRGRLIQQSLSDSVTTRARVFTYNAIGNLIRITEANATHITYDYDASHRLIGMEDQLGNRIDFRIDAMGNRLSLEISDPDGTLVRTQRWVYDQLSQMNQQIDSRQSSTGYGYDANGNLTHVLDANSHPIDHLYDAFDRIIRTTDALKGVTQYNYDADDRPTRIIDPLGRTTQYEYDGLGNLIQLTSPDTGTTQYTYDEAGNRLSKQDARGITTTYIYDELNRVTAIHYPDSSKDVNFTYDQGINGIGRLTAISDAEGVTDYAYNTFGEVVRQSRTSADGIITTFSYAYDAQGELINQVYPSGNMLIFNYDRGQLDGMSLLKPDGTTQSLMAHLQYLPFGAIQSLEYGNGLHLNRSFDQDYRLTEQRIPGLLENQYSHDPVGNIETWQDLLDSGRDQHFVYDKLDRLTTASGSYGGIGYTYDAIGNRLYDSAITENRVITTPSRLPIYDEAGNAIQDAGNHYSYDDTNRMTAFNNSRSDASYGYNGKGERVRKTVNGITTRFRYGQAGQLLGEYDHAGQLIREYVYLDGQPIAMIREQQSTSPSLLQSVTLNQTVHSVDLGQHSDIPVIIASPLTDNDNQGAVAALDEITPNQAVVRVKEWDYLDGLHAQEDVSLLALPPGRYPQADGSIWEVGRFNLSGTRQWYDINFDEVFADTPYLFLTQQSQNEPDTTMVRARNISTTGFQAYLQEQESLNDGHGTETIGYLAIYSPNQGGTANFYGTSFDYQLSKLSLNHTWTTHGDQQLHIQEEASLDSELGHATETLDIMDIEGHLFAQDITTNGGDTIALRRQGPTSTILLSGNPADLGIIYLHTDHLGAVIKATDGEQNLVWDAMRKPFGERRVTATQVEMPLGFPGQYFDQESNNYYNYFRDYDPTTGRYLQSDPIGLGGGINTYAYVDGNPLSYIDPDGLQYLGAPPPPGMPGGPWSWQPDPDNSRGGRYQDPKGNRANWDPSGHWDVEDKDGNRQRYDRWGNKTDRHRNPNRKGSDKPILNWPKPKVNPLYWIPNICIFMPELCDPNLRPDNPDCS